MPRNAVDYEDDFYAWTVEQARLLRTGATAEIDAANIAEEIESMGRRDRREIENRATVLIAHLLKWQFQSEQRSTSWTQTIREQRRQIDLILDDSPSLRPVVAESIDDAYIHALEDAAGETGLAEAAFPTACPFTPEAVLARSFLPD